MPEILPMPDDDERKVLCPPDSVMRAKAAQASARRTASRELRDAMEQDYRSMCARHGFPVLPPTDLPGADIYETLRAFAERLSFSEQEPGSGVELLHSLVLSLALEFNQPCPSCGRAPMGVV